MADSTQGGGGLLGMDPDMLFSLGTGLMSAAKYGGNVGDSLQQAMSGYYARKQAQQQLGMGKLQLQQLQQEMPLRMQYLKAGGQELYQANNDPQVTQQLQSGGLLGSPQQQPSSVPNVPGIPSLMGSAPISAGMMAPQGAPQQQPQQMPPQSMQPQQQAPMGAADPFRQLQEARFGALLGMPGAAQDMDAAKTQLQYDPRLATQMEAAKNPLTVDQGGYQQALQRGDQSTAAMWKVKMEQDAGTLQVARNSGIRQTFDPTTGQWSMYNPEQMTQGTGNDIAPIPGAVQTRQALAAASSRGEAAGQLEEVTNPVTGQRTFVPKSSLLPGGSNSAPSSLPTPALGTKPPANGAATVPPPSGAVAGLGTQTEAYLRTRGTQAADYLTESQKAAENARDTNYSIDQMFNAAKGTSIGPGAPLRQWGEKWLATLGQPLGLDPPPELANYTEIEKYGNKIAFAAAKAMGSREAAQIVTLQIQSNPNKAMVPEAFYTVGNSMKAMNSYIIDKNAYLQSVGQDAQGAAAKWTQQVDPRVWALTTSPEMGKNWGPQIGRAKIKAAFEYMTPEEQQSVIRNLPASVLSAK